MHKNRKSFTSQHSDARIMDQVRSVLISFVKCIFLNICCVFLCIVVYYCLYCFIIVIVMNGCVVVFLSTCVAQSIARNFSQAIELRVVHRISKVMGTEIANSEHIPHTHSAVNPAPGFRAFSLLIRVLNPSH